MQDAGPARDFAGYRQASPCLRWPGGADLAVSFVLNVEEGAELALSAGDERNEARHEILNEVRGHRDLCMESHFEYGARVGYRRIVDQFIRRGIPLTLNVCARALEATPWVADDARRADIEVMCHGWRWEPHVGMDEAHERALIARCVETIERLTGRPPVGWHCKGSASVNTRRLLVEHGGFLYDSDAYNDDLPYRVTVDVDGSGRPHLVLPYAFDTNDMRFFEGPAFVTGDDFARYALAAADWLAAESAETGSPRMLSIGLHTRIIGRPSRIGGLVTLLEALGRRAGVWCATREQIARYWLANDGSTAA